MRLYGTNGDGKRVVWQIARSGKTVTTALGGDGEKTRSHATLAKAKAVHAELVAKQREAGFRALGEVPAPEVAIARNPEFEAEIRRHREDPEPYLVYADWLQGQGSPLGELLVLAQRGKRKKAAALAARVGLPGEDMAKIGWRHGMWQWLHLDNHVDHMDGEFDAIAFARALFASPLCAVLDELRVGMLRWEYQDQPKVIAEAAVHPWAADLRRLRLGDVARGIDMNHHSVGDVGAAITKTFPRLESLWIHSGEYSGDTSFGIAGLDLPALTQLTIETCAMSKKRIKALLSAKLPKVERLEIWFGSLAREATATVSDVAPLWERPVFPRLRHLGLCNSELVAGFVREIPASPLAKRLESLDLSRGTLGDDDAATLAESAARFPKLVELDVSRSYLTRAGIRALKAAFPRVKVIAPDQQPEYDEEDYGQRRFASIHE